MAFSFAPFLFFWKNFCLVQGNCTFPLLSLLWKVSILIGGIKRVDNYQLYYHFVGPSDRALSSHVSSIQADHLLPSIPYSFVRKHVRVDCWGSWSNILGHYLSLGLSSLVSLCIVSLFSQHLCSLFLGDARHLISLLRSFNYSASQLCSFLTP